VRISLPPSLIATNDPTEEKLALYRDMTPAQRAAITAAVCRSAAALLALHPDRQRVLDLESPLPPSSIAALRRLRNG
jgi:hypothetical protein